MTEDEKKRLNELMVENENDEKDFSIEYDPKTQTNNQVVDYNPFEIKLAAGDGYQPSLNEQQRLHQIDSQLESRNYSRLLTGSRNSVVTIGSAYTNSNSKIISEIDAESYRSILSDQKKIKLNDDFDENEFGDKFIREAKISREQQTRLKIIDSQLDTMRSTSEATNFDNSSVRSV